MGESTGFYDIHVFCCVHKRPDGHRRGSCADKGSKQLCDLMCRLGMVSGLRRMRVNHAGCMNMCEHGPTMVIYPDNIWYRFETESDIKEILYEHIRHNRRVDRLHLDPEKITLAH